jgi:phosphatidylglycerophosphate synthase
MTSRHLTAEHERLGPSADPCVRRPHHDVVRSWLGQVHWADLADAWLTHPERSCGPAHRRSLPPRALNLRGNLVVSSNNGNGGSVRTVRHQIVGGVVTQGVVLAGVSLLAGLTSVGWVVGLVSAGVMNLLVALALARRDPSRLHGRRIGPANTVTWVRATLACAVAGLVADGFTRARPVAAVVALSACILVLDNVDGRVARRAGVVSAFGARFDMEVDAFLILVLSVDVARLLGVWVLAIGAMRYALWAAERVLLWLREPLPARYWRKVVAAVQGIVLVVAASGLVSRTVSIAVVLAALGLLVESFGRDLWWLARRHGEVAPRARRAPRRTPEFGLP